jgi:hypothetical protein
LILLGNATTLVSNADATVHIVARDGDLDGFLLGEVFFAWDFDGFLLGSWKFAMHYFLYMRWTEGSGW